MTVIDQKNVGEFWSSRDIGHAANKPWHSDQITAYRNKRMCGQSLPGKHDGFVTELRRLYPERTFARGVSVGAGFASREMALLKAGIVQHFTVYELSAKRIEEGRGRAERSKLADRISFHQGDAFEAKPEQYDMVHWKGALHHMPDTAAAVRWSYDRLKSGGVFVMEEYTGPNRLQYDDRLLAMCDHVLRLVPDSFFQDGDRVIERKCVRPSQHFLRERDPSEAVDSVNILPAVNATFPDARLYGLGGVVYFVALRKVLKNFKPDNDEHQALMARLLDIDGALADKGESLAHGAIAEKP